VAPGGLYIIEDLYWQSPCFENDLPAVRKTWLFLQAWFERSEYIENQLGQAEMEWLRDRSPASALSATGGYAAAQSELCP
jgi:hypothetical protein